MIPLVFLILNLILSMNDALELAPQPSFQQSKLISMFYCGFGPKYCGQSSIDDVNSKADIVILAFANVLSDGRVVVDDSNFPKRNKDYWQRSGKKVLFSIGGQNGNFDAAFQSPQHITNFILTVIGVIDTYGFDGVDLNIQNYRASPRTVASVIIDLKKLLRTQGRSIISVTPETISVYQGVAVPSPDQGGNPWNYFVHIINLADDYIDYYQVQGYNNWFGFAPGSLQYFQNVYLNWRNMQGLDSSHKPIPNFIGVPSEKLLIGFLASRDAGITDYYAIPDVIREFKSYLKSNRYQIAGFMIWNSHWDQLNQFLISNALAQN